MKMNQIQKLLAIIIPLSFFSACEDVGEDSLPEPDFKTSEISVNLVSGSVGFIDIRSVLDINQEISVQISELPLSGEISIDRELIKYTPGEAFTSGEDSFRISILDNAGVSVSDNNVEVNVVERDSINSNCGYFSFEDKVVASQEEVVLFDFKANTYICTDVIVNIISPPDFGTLVPDGDLFKYTPEPGFKGTDRFTYEYCNPENTSECAVVLVILEYQTCDFDALEAFDDTFFLDILNAPDLDSLNGDLDSLYSIDVLKNDVFCLDDAVSLEILQQPKYGTVMVNSNTFPPFLDYLVGSSDPDIMDTLTYQLCQGSIPDCDEALLVIEY